MTNPTPLARWSVVYTDTKGITHLWHSYPSKADAIADASHLTGLTTVRRTGVLDTVKKLTVATFGATDA